MVYEHYISIIFVVCLLFKLITQLYLSLRNKKYIQQNRSNVPNKFAAQISLEEHQKAADYTLEKARFGRIMLVFEALLLFLWTLGGGLAHLSQFLQRYDFKSQYTHGLLLFLSFGILSWLLGLLPSLYSTFVIEERYGFNKMTLKTYLGDTFKQWLLGVLLGAPILWLLLFLMNSFQAYWWLLGFLSVTLFQMLLLIVYPIWIAPLFNKFTPLQDGEVKQKVEQLLKQIDFPFKGLFIMNASIRSSHGNAYFTGLGRHKRIVFFDTLIETLTPNEVQAVLAHEVGHYKKKHVLKGLLKSTLLSLVGFYLLGKLAYWPFFFSEHGVPQSHAMALLLFSLVSGVYTFFLIPISAYVSRKYEYEADEFAAKESSASELISALVKMYRDNASTLTPDPLYSQFYFSHPPALERVRFLETFTETNETGYIPSNN